MATTVTVDMVLCMTMAMAIDIATAKSSGITIAGP